MDDRKLAEAFYAHATRYPDLRLHVHWGDGEPPQHLGQDSVRDVNDRPGHLWLRYYNSAGADEFAALAHKASRLLKPELRKFVDDWQAWEPFGELAWVEAMTVAAPALSALRADNLIDGFLAPEMRRFCEFKLSPAAASAEFIDALCPKKRKPRRKRTQSEPRPLTTKQVQACELYAECDGNFTEVGRRMGVGRKTAKEHYDAAAKKVGKLALGSRPKTMPLMTDNRGQVTSVRGDRKRHTKAIDED